MEFLSEHTFALALCITIIVIIVVAVLAAIAYLFAIVIYITLRTATVHWAGATFAVVAFSYWLSRRTVFTYTKQR